MTAHLNLDDMSSLKAKINEKAHDLFKAKPEGPQLEAKRLVKTQLGEEKEAVRDVKIQDVENICQIRALEHESNDSSQIFVVRQDRSWTTINISRQLFEDFLSVYSVFSHFWKCMFTFGRKSEENEFEFPGFRARYTPLSNSSNCEIYESAYVLRRAELNHRVLTEGQSPWSIRQTAVYHKFIPNPDSANSLYSVSCPSSQKCKSVFLLVAPSANFEGRLAQSLELSISDERAIAPWNVHRLLVADSLRGWTDYMASLEEQLREQSDRIVLAEVGAEKENLSPLTDFNINFIDRQTLKLLEDSVIDLQVILPTLLSTITGIREQCKMCWSRHCEKKEMCDCDQIIQEFNEHIKEVEMHVKRAEALRERAKSTAQLLSDLLDYENAVALKDLARESRLESKSMYCLTVRSTKDAAAVKILTVITLIYLPTTIVSNFFSTQFVKTDDSGDMQIATNVWLLAAISVPLTAITIAMWWTWVYCSKVEPPNISQQASVPKVQRQDCIRSLLSSKKKQRSNDVESGTAPPQNIMNQPETPPPSFRNSSTGTWSSTATTAKSG